MKGNNEGRSQSRSAFTLIEMLVVLAVIALLATLVVPSTSSALRRARGVKCLANMREWGNAVLLYLQESPDQKFPTEGSGSFGHPDLTEKTAWFNVLPPYMGVEPLQTALEEEGALPRPGDGSFWTCPLLPADKADGFPSDHAYFSFGYNLWIDHSVETPYQRTRDLRNAGLLAVGETAPYPPLLRAVNIQEPSRFVVFAEIENGRYATYNIKYVDYRHQGRKEAIHMIFADGSARAYTREEVGVTAGKHVNRGGVIHCPGGLELP